MLIAVAKKKAKMSKLTGARKEPREDLVTSAIFGSLQLLPSEEQAIAIADIFENKPDADRKFEFIYWPTWDGCEPDVVIEVGNGGKLETIIVIEVKWGANLGQDQLERQKVASEEKYPGASRRYFLLGAEPKHDVGKTGFLPISWRYVTERLQNRLDESSSQGGPLGLWRKQVLEFLHQTDKGRIFAGFKNDWGTLPSTSYSYEWRGKQPWFQGVNSCRAGAVYTFNRED
jgi:hypothetical protein